MSTRERKDHRQRASGHHFGIRKTCFFHVSYCLLLISSLLLSLFFVFVRYINSESIIVSTPFHPIIAKKKNNASNFTTTKQPISFWRSSVLCTSSSTTSKENLLRIVSLTKRILDKLSVWQQQQQHLNSHYPFAQWHLKVLSSIILTARRLFYLIPTLLLLQMRVEMEMCETISPIFSLCFLFLFLLFWTFFFFFCFIQYKYPLRHPTIYPIVQEPYKLRYLYTFYECISIVTFSYNELAKDVQCWFFALFGCNLVSKPDVMDKTNLGSDLLP